MKRILTIITGLFILSSNSFSQTKEYVCRLDSTIHKYIGGVYVKEYYEYNADNRIEKTICYKMENSWKPAYMYQYKYDDKGNNTSIIVFKHEGEDWHLSNKYEAVYDKDGHTESTMHYNYNRTNGKWNMDMKNVFRYSGGLCVSLDFIDNSVDGNVKRHTYVYEYDEHENMTSRTMYEDGENGKDTIYRAEYIYDDNGMKVEESEYYYNDDKTRRGKSCRIFNYEDDGKLKSRKIARMQKDRTWNFSTQIFTVRGPKGNIVCEETFSCKDDAHLGTSIHIHDLNVCTDRIVMPKGLIDMGFLNAYKSITDELRASKYKLSVIQSLNYEGKTDTETYFYYSRIN